jgi:hypothetical protein
MNQQEFFDWTTKLIGGETTIHANGSKWLGDEPDTLDQLIDVLGRYKLRPEFGNCECEHEGAVHFLGNFANLSHVFRIETTDQAVIDRLRAVIADNATLAN